VLNFNFWHSGVKAQINALEQYFHMVHLVFQQNRNYRKEPLLWAVTTALRKPYRDFLINSILY